MTNNSGIAKFIRSAKRDYSDKEFSEFLDTNGFSVIGTYDKGYRRQMGITDTVNVVPFAKFYFDDEDIDGEGEYIPVKIHISMTSKVIERGEARYMLNDSRIKRLKPIDLIVTDEFFIDREKGLAYEGKNGKYKRIELGKVYDRLYKAHTSRINSLKGSYHRIKIIVLRKLPAVVLSIISWLLGIIYWWLRGKFFKYDYIVESVKDRMRDPTTTKESEEPKTTIDFFGYKVGVWSLTTYSIVIVVVFLFTQNTWLVKLPENNALATVYSLALAIVSIVLYDKILPTATKYIIKWSSKTSFKCQVRGIKIKV